MTLAGRAVVVCRATAQAGPLVERLNELGVNVVHVPLIEIVPPADDGTELRRRVQSLTDRDWLAFTSANGVDAVRAALAGAVPPSLVAAVGGATARRAAELGWSVDFTSPVTTASGLGASLEVDPGGRVLAPLAELASTDLVDALRLRGIEVEAVTAYRTAIPLVSSGEQQRIVDSDVVLVTAPSVIDRLVALIDPADLPALIAIGPTSATAIEAVGLVARDVAETSSVDGLIDAVVRTLQE